MTLEAALVLPLFIFASVSLILPMKIMNTERKIQAGLEAAGEELSQYAYLQDVMMNGEEEQIPGADSYAKDFAKILRKLPLEFMRSFGYRNMWIQSR